MTFIPHRGRPIHHVRFAETVRVIDPVTGAMYFRPRHRPQKPDPKSNGEPLPATCSTPFCQHAGRPHDECIVQPHCIPHDEFPVSFVPHPWHHRPVIPLPQRVHQFRHSQDQDAFKRWLQSFPHWRIPREMPPGWRNPGHPEPQNTPHRPANQLPHREPIPPVRAMPPPMAPVPAPWPNAPDLPNRVPDVVQWNNVQGGKLQWTPHPWVAHPLPHPDIPAQAFWESAGGANALHPWWGPGGWIPRPGLDAERASLITGGHPLPGMDPFWTPTQWVPPLHPPRAGVYISPWISPSPRNANVPHILWDAAVQPPYRIRRLTSRGVIVDFSNTEFFKQQATHPGVNTLRIHLPNMGSSWGPVVINKDTPIEVGDIFDAVWKYLHKPITHREWQAIRASYGWQRCQRIEYAMYRRCWRGAGLYDYVISQGIKRVDLMEGNTIFWGTYLTYNADSTWYLTMAFVPEPRTA